MANKSNGIMIEVKDNGEIRDYAKSMIQEQVRSIVREELKAMIDESLKSTIQSIKNDMNNIAKTKVDEIKSRIITDSRLRITESFDNVARDERKSMSRIIREMLENEVRARVNESLAGKSIRVNSGIEILIEG